jgi:hypothetical protein
VKGFGGFHATIDSTPRAMLSADTDPVHTHLSPVYCKALMLVVPSKDRSLARQGHSRV